MKLTTKDIVLGAIIVVLMVTCAIQFYTRPGKTDSAVVDLKRQKDSLLTVIKRNSAKLDSLAIADAVKDSIISHKEINITNIYENGKKDYYSTLSLDAHKSIVLWADRISKERTAAANGH